MTSPAEAVPQEPERLAPARGILRSRRLGAALAVAMLGLGLDALVIEPSWVRLRDAGEVRMLPSGARPLVIALVSDLHVASMHERDRRAAEIVASIAPDLVLVAGDLSAHDATDEGEGIRDSLAAFKEHARLGVFVVPGNCDHYGGRGAVLAAAAERAGAILLRNEVRSIPLEPSSLGELAIVGLDDPYTGHADLAGALARAPAGPRLVLAHSPEIFPSVHGRAVDLVLAGHTHGGQIVLPFYGPPWLPPGSEPYLSGWFQEGTTRMFVTQGVGMSILPVRFNCRPEVAKIVLVPR